MNVLDEKVAAVISTFNPNINRLIMSLNMITEQCVFAGIL
jgi:hypothetical protein